MKKLLVLILCVLPMMAMAQEQINSPNPIIVSVTTNAAGASILATNTSAQSRHFIHIENVGSPDVGIVMGTGIVSTNVVQGVQTNTYVKVEFWLQTGDSWELPTGKIYNGAFAARTTNGVFGAVSVTTSTR